MALRWATLQRPFVQFSAAPCDTISDLPTLQPCWFRQHVVWHWVTARFRCLRESLEFPASWYQGRAFTAHLPSKTQNWTVQAVLPCWLTVCSLYCSNAHSNCRLFIADLGDIWHCKVVLQQKCDSATLIICIVNNNNNKYVLLISIISIGTVTIAYYCWQNTVWNPSMASLSRLISS